MKYCQFGVSPVNHSDSDSDANADIQGNEYADRLAKNVQVVKDQEKAQSEKDSHSKNRGGEKTKLTIRYLYNENIS